jgi:dipeptidyl-peptidase-3
LNDAQGDELFGEFYDRPETIARQKKYGTEAGDLMTALHEIVGHGSGKLNPRFVSGTEPLLKEYFSTLEEARADLMALWNIWDPKLKELGLIGNQEEVAKAMYDQRMLQVVMQLRTIRHGNTIEEDHQRNRALIANYVIDRTGAVEIVHRDGKTYVRVNDYQKARAGVGELLAELMRIKAEGDYAAIKALVDKYGVHFDPAVRDEVVSRYARLNLPTYWSGVYPRLTASLHPDGTVGTVTATDQPDAVHQFLEFAAMYDPGLAAAR